MRSYAKLCEATEGVHIGRDGGRFISRGLTTMCDTDRVADYTDMYTWHVARPGFGSKVRGTTHDCVHQDASVGRFSWDGAGLGRGSPRPAPYPLHDGL